MTAMTSGPALGNKNVQQGTFSQRPFRHNIETETQRFCFHTSKRSDLKADASYAMKLLNLRGFFNRSQKTFANGKFVHQSNLTRSQGKSESDKQVFGARTHFFLKELLKNL
jgi:hypothetical protein